MIQKLVSLWLLPCVLMSQSAGVLHAHGGSEPVGHETRPHLHLGGLAHAHVHAHVHSHEHGHGGQHHDPGTGRREQDHGDPSPGADSRPGTQLASPSEHDSDAVYLGRWDAVAAARSTAESKIHPLLDQALDAWSRAELPAVVPTRDRIGWAHSPPARGPRLPLYLRQLALLI